ncbi:MAG: hypothetical protein R6V12_05680, partial [Candidatus Hydrogenedentota bacterium]
QTEGAMAIVGSSGYLEISLKDGSASATVWDIHSLVERSSKRNVFMQPVLPKAAQARRPKAVNYPC